MALAPHHANNGGDFVDTLEEIAKEVTDSLFTGKTQGWNFLCHYSRPMQPCIGGSVLTPIKDLFDDQVSLML